MKLVGVVVKQLERWWQLRRILVCCCLERGFDSVEWNLLNSRICCWEEWPNGDGSRHTGSLSKKNVSGSDSLFASIDSEWPTVADVCCLGRPEVLVDWSICELSVTERLMQCLQGRSGFVPKLHSFNKGPSKCNQRTPPRRGFVRRDSVEIKSPA